MRQTGGCIGTRLANAVSGALAVMLGGCGPAPAGAPALDLDSALRNEVMAQVGETTGDGAPLDADSLDPVDSAAEADVTVDVGSVDALHQADAVGVGDAAESAGWEDSENSNDGIDSLPDATPPDGGALTDVTPDGGFADPTADLDSADEVFDGSDATAEVAPDADAPADVGLDAAPPEDPGPAPDAEPDPGDMAADLELTMDAPPPGDFAVDAEPADAADAEPEAPDSTKDAAMDVAEEAGADLAVDASPDVALDPGPPPCVASAELCNAEDDDCDGQIDDEPSASASCDDGDPCTGKETCVAGMCSHTPAAPCDDGNTCTLDTCLAGEGCQAIATAGPCSDGNACTTGDACAATTCTAGKPVTCDDANPCTTDACAVATGDCSHVPIPGCGAPTSGRFQTVFGGDGLEDDARVLVLGDGAIALAGHTATWGAGSSDGLLVKTDGCGKPLWSRAYGGPGKETVLGLALAPDGGFALAGGTSSFGKNGDFWVVRTDPAGKVVWSIAHGGTGYDFAQSIEATSDGGFIVAGKTFSFGPNTPLLHNGMVAKLDANGKAAWSQVLAGGDGSMDAIAAREVRGPDGLWDGYALLGGSEGVGAGHDDVWLTRLDAAGKVLWSKVYGGSGDDNPVDFLQTADGEFIVVGSTNGFGAMGDDLFLMRADADGDLKSFRKLASPGGKDEARRVGATAAGFVLVGRSNGFGKATDLDGLTVAFDPSGKVVSARTYSVGPKEDLQDVAVLPAGGLVLGGRTDGPGSGDLWLLRTDASGAIGCSDKALAPTALLESGPKVASESFSPKVLAAGSTATAAAVTTVVSLDEPAQAACPCKP